MRTAGLIVAAGRGRRLGGETPKQYLPIGRHTVVRRSVVALLAHPAVDLVQLVIHPADRALCAVALDGLADVRLLPPVDGGASRSDSVLAGLEALAPAAPDRVLIHDAARPFLRPGLISAVLDVLDAFPAALPALPVVDALWRAADGRALAPASRDGLWRAQTPQGFRFAEILAAHRARSGDALDDAAVALAAGLEVALIEGDEGNFKITTAADLDRARARMGEVMDIRTGNGFDVHAFGPGSGVKLCGVAIPFDRGLVGHSDADVGMHALTDAIFGALAEGDIGQWFPPSDPAWKGAASEVFLRKAVARATDRGFAVSHLDCTLVCEAPKIGPHAAAMRQALGRITGLEAERISVKATTSERLGFTGRGEGIAALATATLGPAMTRFIATFGFVGSLPGPAGTWGSLVALPLGYLLHLTGGPLLLALGTLVAYGLGHWATRVETFEQDDLDPSHIVIDEVVGQWIALLPLSFGLWLASAPPQLFPWPGWVAAFLLFRIFDIWKPGPVGWADRRKGPTGVMLDDVVAGALAGLVVTLLAGIAHGWLM